METKNIRSKSSSLLLLILPSAALMNCDDIKKLLLLEQQRAAGYENILLEKKRKIYLTFRQPLIQDPTKQEQREGNPELLFLTGVQIVPHTATIPTITIPLERTQ